MKSSRPLWKLSGCEGVVGINLRPLLSKENMGSGNSMEERFHTEPCFCVSL